MTAYGTVTQLKGRTERTDALSAALTATWEEMLEAISRKIDNICKVPDNYFVADSVDDTRHLSGTGENSLLIPHAMSITTVSVKVDYDDTAYVAWSTPSTTYAGDGDWYLIAGNPKRPVFNHTPYTYLMIDPNGDYSYFPNGENFWNVTLLGKFGYSTAAPADIRECCLAEAVVLIQRFGGLMDDSQSNTDMGQLMYRIRMSELTRNSREFLLAGGWMLPLYATQRA